MVEPRPNGAQLAAAIALRHGEIADRVDITTEDELRAPSLLPGWSRETILCHLRYGARASRLLAVDALAGERGSFYPLGRDHQRDRTLRRDDDESLAGLVASFREEAQQLDAAWAELTDAEWATQVVEPADNADLGPVSLWMYALLRLTEIEVHGTDLGLDLAPWSDTFVRAALPARIEWLPQRRSNHGAVEPVEGTWLLAASDGPVFTVVSDRSGVRVERTSLEAAEDATGAIIRGSSHQLLAFLLGRNLDGMPPAVQPASASADFHAAFPPP